MKYMIVLLYVLCIVLISFRIYKLFKTPSCGGTLNPNLRYCKEDTLVVNQTIPEDECNPISLDEKTRLFLEFVRYLSQKPTSSYVSLHLETKFQSQIENIESGNMIFSIPPLLKLLPSDFGQNEITPYGVMSFYNTYIRKCISNTEKLCQLFPLFCNNIPHSIGQCPFDVNDGNQNLEIEDVSFFNLVGLLGTFSLNERQVLVLYYDMPLEMLDLNYWSFTLYLADRLKKNEKCRPYRQTYLASLLPPMNCFHTPALAQKRFNPLRGTGNVLKQGHLSFYLVVSLNETLGNTVKNYLEERNETDFVHLFSIPKKMTIDERLPNPNGLTENDPLYDPKTDRLSMFLRLSPSPSSDKSKLRDYIYSKDNGAQVCFMTFNNKIMKENNNEKTMIIQPRMIPSIFPETERISSLFHELNSKLWGFMYQSQFYGERLATRHTLFNIFSPLTPSILNTKTQLYENGMQAIQMAGCAQGDNPDAIYRLSEGICLGDEDVMMAICVNHARFGNCLYNNINVLDLNKAYSFASVSYDSSFDVDYYIVLTGRNQELLETTKTRLENLFPNVSIVSVFIPTGPTVKEGIPKCHSIMMVERIYINTLYPSIIPSNNQTYHLQDLFGEDYNEINENVDEDVWNSLLNVTAPDVKTLLPPIYLKFSYPSYRRMIMIGSLSTLLILIIFGIQRIYSQVVMEKGFSSGNKSRKESNT